MLKIIDNWIILEGLDRKKRKCGYIQNMTYYTPRYKPKHWYRIGEGYPIETEILEWLKEHNINEIVIVEKNMNGDKNYRATVDQYLNGQDLKWGYGKQKNVPLVELELIECQC